MTTGHVLCSIVIEAEHAIDFVHDSLESVVQSAGGDVVAIGAHEFEGVVEALGHFVIVTIVLHNAGVDQLGILGGAILINLELEAVASLGVADIEVVGAIVPNFVLFVVLFEHKGAIACPLVVNAELRNNLGILIGLFCIRSDLKGDGCTLLENIGRSKCLRDLGASQGFVEIGLVIGGVDSLYLDILQIAGLNLDLRLAVRHISLHSLAEVGGSRNGYGHDSVNLGARDDGVGLLKNSIAGAAIPGGVGGLLSGQSLDFQGQVLELDFGDLHIPARRESGGCDSEDHDESDCESQNLLHFFVSLSTKSVVF